MLLLDLKGNGCRGRSVSCRESRFRAYAALTGVEDIHDDKLLMQCVAEREERRQHIGCGRQL